MENVQESCLACDQGNVHTKRTSRVWYYKFIIKCLCEYRSRIATLGNNAQMFLRNELGFCSVYNIWYGIFVSFFNIPKINYCVLFNGSKYIVLKHFKTFSSQLLHAHVCSTHLLLCGILRFIEREGRKTYLIHINVTWEVRWRGRDVPSRLGVEYTRLTGGWASSDHRCLK